MQPMVPDGKLMKVVVRCNDDAFDAIVESLRGEWPGPVIAVTAPDGLDEVSEGDAVVFRYLEDTDGNNVAQVRLLERVMNFWPTIICARSPREEFERALEAGDRDALFHMGGCGIRMDLYYRLMNYLCSFKSS